MKTVITAILMVLLTTSAMALYPGEGNRDKFMHFNGAYGIQQSLEKDFGWTYTESIMGCTAMSVIKEGIDELDYGFADPKDFAAGMLGCFASQLNTEHFRVVAKSTTREEYIVSLGTRRVDSHYMGLQWDVDFPFGSKQMIGD